MSIQTLTRFLCDAPHCDAVDIGPNILTPPGGWIRLDSTAHISAISTASPPARRRRSRSSSYVEHRHGSFALHLCPQHPEAFISHWPRTNGWGSNSNVSVSCSCGVQLGIVPDVTMVNKYPAHAPEAAWYRHLPEDLRWYLWRGATQWALSRASYHTTVITPYRDEASARDALARVDGSVLVRRATDADPWKKTGD